VELVVFISRRKENLFESYYKEYWNDLGIFSEKETCIEKIYNKLANPVGAKKQKEWTSESSVQLSSSFFQENSHTTGPSDLRKRSVQRRWDEEIKSTPDLHSPKFQDELCFSSVDLSQRKFKIIDYGNCYGRGERREGLISTRQYRSPEVLLSKYKYITITSRHTKMV
jgi:hypothetical protein